MASKMLMELLNRGIARELQVSVQYRWQHVLATGVESAAVEDIFREIVITEMKHAEEIAEKLAYLGGTPTTKPDPIFVGESLKEMLQRDVKAEEEAIALYKQTVKVADNQKAIRRDSELRRGTSRHIYKASREIGLSSEKGEMRWGRRLER